MLAHRHHRPGRHRGGVTDVYHQVICRHQVEIEVWPPRAEVHFRDDWTANPATTEVRFEAQVYNSTQGFLWEVRDIHGGPGQGTIDAGGLYRAPPKGGLANGTTELVIATSREDPLRKAFAWVTLVGVGPKPVKAPEVAIWPRVVTLYYGQGAANRFISECNKVCEFRATVYDSNAQVEWVVDPPGSPPGTVAGFGPWFLYQAPPNGGPVLVTVRAQLQGQTGVFEDAKVLQMNFDWPGV